MASGSHPKVPDERNDLHRRLQKSHSVLLGVLQPTGDTLEVTSGRPLVVRHGVLVSTDLLAVRRTGWPRVLVALGGVLAFACGTSTPKPADSGPVPTGLIPDADAPPVTAPAGTPLHHAQTCAQYLGPIPAMSCSDAALMPITVDGVEVTETPATCDRPSALTGTCETGERIAARYPGSHHDGSERPEVVFINFCRDGGMGVIGHNSETGATCFFHINMAHENSVVHPGSADPAYDDYWQTAEVVAADNCQGCHQADPWLHSPWIDQLRDPSNPDRPLVPVTAGPDAPYTVVGEGFSQPVHAGAPDNSCTSCHRPQCDTNFAVPLGELVMPGPFADSTFTEEGTADLQALREWCRDLHSGGGGGDDGGEEGVCDEAFECIERCGSDYDCGRDCVSTHVEDTEHAATMRALLDCADAAGCDFDDDGCLISACPSEVGAFEALCG